MRKLQSILATFEPADEGTTSASFPAFQHVPALLDPLGKEAATKTKKKFRDLKDKHEN